MRTSLMLAWSDRAATTPDRLARLRRNQAGWSKEGQGQSDLQPLAFRLKRREPFREIRSLGDPEPRLRGVAGPRGNSDAIGRTAAKEAVVILRHPVIPVLRQAQAGRGAKGRGCKVRVKTVRHR